MAYQQLHKKRQRPDAILKSEQVKTQNNAPALRDHNYFIITKTPVQLKYRQHTKNFRRKVKYPIEIVLKITISRIENSTGEGVFKPRD